MFAVQDVVTDSYGNPAIVVRVNNVGTPFETLSIVQLAGSDYGRFTSISSTNTSRVTSEAQVAWARERFAAIPETTRNRIRAILGSSR